MVFKMIGYTPSSFEEWKEIMKRELNKAKNFEIRCWNEEEEQIKLALCFGEIQPSDQMFEKIIAGEVTQEFREHILQSPEPKGKEIYDKFTSYFSIFLDHGFSSEHYGTEIYKR